MNQRRLTKRDYPEVSDDGRFLSCRMPDCKGFASTAAGFVRHMKRKHGVEVDRIAVAARQLVAVVRGPKKGGESR